jgi:hypothetical protein
MQRLQLANILTGAGPFGLDVEDQRRFVLWFGDPAKRKQMAARSPFAYVRWLGKNDEARLSLDLALETGQILNCCLSLYAPQEKIVVNRGSPQHLSGIPVFNRDNLRREFEIQGGRYPMIIDLKQPFNIEITGSILRIVLCPGTVTHQVLHHPRAHFEFNAQDLLAIQIEHQDVPRIRL